MVGPTSVARAVVMSMPSSDLIIIRFLLEQRTPSVEKNVLQETHISRQVKRPIAKNGGKITGEGVAQSLSGPSSRLTP